MIRLGRLNDIEVITIGVSLIAEYINSITP
jgi:hypothetical protein